MPGQSHKEGLLPVSVMKIPGHDHQRPREVMLEEIENLMGNCQRCELGQTRTHLVFGVGNPHARVMFVGEGPGRNEDLKGEPFVGAAGHKLDSLLELAGLTRPEIYIANVVKCRPPGNRNPKPAEIEACSPFLREQIRSIWPDVIVCLGNFASQWVLKTDRGVTTLRGQLYQQGHFVVCPTFHPAACIYHSDWQPLLEEDLRRVGAWLKANPQKEDPAEAAREAMRQAGIIHASTVAGKAPRGAGVPEAEPAHGARPAVEMASGGARPAVDMAPGAARPVDRGDAAADAAAVVPLRGEGAR